MKSFAHWRWLAPLSLVGLVASGGFNAALGQEASAPRLGFVSLDKILRDSEPAKAAQAKLEAEFGPRRRDLADSAARLKAQYELLEKNAAITGDSERARRQREFSDQDKEFQRRQREFNEDLTQRQNEEFAAVVEKANQVIRRIASAEKYDLIVQEAVFVNPRIDITDKVIAVLNTPTASPSAPASAPAQ
jgi:outer membrane protein